MQQREVEVHGLSHNVLIDTCGRSGQPDQALRVLRDLRERRERLVPDVASYNAAVSARSSGRREGRPADEMLSRGQLLDQTQAYKLPLGGVRQSAPEEQPGNPPRLPEEHPHQATMRESAVAASPTGNRLKEALELIDEMLRGELLPDIITYAAALGMCESAVQSWATLPLLAGAARFAESTVRGARGSVSVAPVRDFHGLKR